MIQLPDDKFRYIFFSKLNLFVLIFVYMHKQCAYKNLSWNMKFETNLIFGTIFLLSVFQLCQMTQRFDGLFKTGTVI